jgi:hypothetical protein
MKPITTVEELLSLPSCTQLCWRFANTYQRISAGWFYNMSCKRVHELVAQGEVFYWDKEFAAEYLVRTKSKVKYLLKSVNFK